jgi:Rrf2 family protein
MKIARETDYAVRCLLFMARRPLAVHTVGEIAVSQKIPPSFLAKILQKLVRAGLLSSTRGVRGGFRFRSAPRDVTLLSAIEAVEGSLALYGRRVEGRRCPRVARVAAHPVWKKVQQDMAGTLARYSIQDLAESERTPAAATRG